MEFFDTFWAKSAVFPRKINATLYASGSESLLIEVVISHIRKSSQRIDRFIVHIHGVMERVHNLLWRKYFSLETYSSAEGSGVVVREIESELMLQELLVHIQLVHIIDVQLGVSKVI